jgi:hypothetical protein
MCRMLRHTTLLLSGMAGLEWRRVKMAKQGHGLLFTGAEKLAKLAGRSCSNSWTKPLPTFVKVVEECLIFNFASDPKMHFSLKNWRKAILKTASANCFYLGTPEHSHARCRARVPRQRPYTRAARARWGTGGPSGPCAACESANVGDDRERLDGARWPSSTIAGTRVPAAAAGPPPSSSPLCRFPEPRQPLSASPRSHGSSPCGTWLSPAPSLTAVRVPAGAPPLLRRRRSPETPPAEPPLPISHW